jgi:hypothetical protein
VNLFEYSCPVTKFPARKVRRKWRSTLFNLAVLAAFAALAGYLWHNVKAAAVLPPVPFGRPGLLLAVVPNPPGAAGLAVGVMAILAAFILAHAGKKRQQEEKRQVSYRERGADGRWERIRERTQRGGAAWTCQRCLLTHTRGCDEIECPAAAGFTVGPLESVGESAAEFTCRWPLEPAAPPVFIPHDERARAIRVAAAELRSVHRLIVSAERCTMDLDDHADTLKTAEGRLVKITAVLEAVIDAADLAEPLAEMKGGWPL